MTAGGVLSPRWEFACRAGAVRGGVGLRSPEEEMLRGGPVRSSDAVPSGGCSLTVSLPPGGGSSSARTEPAVRTVRGSSPPGLRGVAGWGGGIGVSWSCTRCCAAVGRTSGSPRLGARGNDPALLRKGSGCGGAVPGPCVMCVRVMVMRC